MKKPRFMNMDELLALPIIVEARRAHADAFDQAASLGGCFRDREGALWGTCLVDSGWARYPAALALHAA